MEPLENFKKRSEKTCKDCQNHTVLPEIESNNYCRSRKKEHEEAYGIGEDSCVFTIEPDCYSELTLMEEVALFAVGGDKSRIPLFNDDLPYILRCCILFELALRGKIHAERSNSPMNDLWLLKVEVKDSSPTGDQFLDEVLGKITHHRKLDVKTWIDVLTGESWRSEFSDMQLRHLRERVCKSLIEKGKVRAEKSTIFIFETTSYPMVDCKSKDQICSDIIETCAGSKPLGLRTGCLIASLHTANLVNRVTRQSGALASSPVKNFSEMLMKDFGNVDFLLEKYRRSHDESALFLICGIISLFAKMQKLI